jgi:hypothetical protein
MMNNTAWSFDEKARSLAQCFHDRFNVSANEATADQEFVVSFFGKTYTVSYCEVRDQDGHMANPAISVLLMEYLLNKGHHTSEPSPWISFRECSGAGPLMGHFHENTVKTIERTFAGRLDSLKESSHKLGGDVLNDDGSFDLSIQFESLPGVPVLLRFNDRDDSFAATCQILFKASSEKILGIHSLGVIGTYLTGSLINSLSV